MADEPPVKLFISYSWSDADHQSWVMQIATELREAGVDVILDKWDLKEGHDANAFMEKMVTDPEIKKVALICDKAYADKANKRSGGVGIEAQIITPEIYKKQDQSKFVAIIRERDENGKPCIPTYYGSRLYIDLGNATTYPEEYERLLRWIYDQPLHLKPDIGRKPAFLGAGATTIQLTTAVAFRRASDAIKNARPHAIPALIEYFELFSREMEKFRVSRIEGEPHDETIFKNIEDFIPYRNEAVEIFSEIALYDCSESMISAVHRFFDSILGYTERPEYVHSWNEEDFDNFRFIVQELYIYCVACLLRRERFEAIDKLLAQEFFMPRRVERGQQGMVPFTSFRIYNRSLEARNRRLDLRRLSLTADMLKERCKGTSVNFDMLMSSDFLLFMRSKIQNLEGGWLPDTLLYAGRFGRSFEIFARCKSVAFFDKFKVALGVKSKKDLDTVLVALGQDGLPSWEGDTFNPRVLLGFETMATRP